MNPLHKWRLSLPPHQRSLIEAGKLLGVSGVQMYRYETGKRRVPPEKVEAVSEITGIPKTVLRPDVFRPRRRRLGVVSLPAE